MFILLIVENVNFLEDYCLIVKRRFACPNDLESYVGGSLSSW
jgi:hypothetical protein